jgi:hypothetical protein
MAVEMLARVVDRASRAFVGFIRKFCMTFLFASFTERLNANVKYTCIIIERLTCFFGRTTVLPLSQNRARVSFFCNENERFKEHLSDPHRFIRSFGVVVQHNRTKIITWTTRKLESSGLVLWYIILPCYVDGLI